MSRKQAARRWLQVEAAGLEAKLLITIVLSCNRCKFHFMTESVINDNVTHYCCYLNRYHCHLFLSWWRQIFSIKLSEKLLSYVKICCVVFHSKSFHVFRKQSEKFSHHSSVRNSVMMFWCWWSPRKSVFGRLEFEMNFTKLMMTVLLRIRNWKTMGK